MNFIPKLFCFFFSPFFVPSRKVTRISIVPAAILTRHARILPPHRRSFRRTWKDKCVGGDDWFSSGLLHLGNCIYSLSSAATGAVMSTLCGPRHGWVSAVSL